MIKNFIKTAFRSLLKNKGFTFINVAGLALGLAGCLLIVFYVVDELSYDRYNTKFESIYRVNSDLKYGGVVTSFAIVAPPLADALKHNFPEVEEAVRISPALNIRFKNGNEEIAEDKVIYCDPSIFDVFTLPMIDGDPKTALNDPNAIVITEAAAKKYFNKTNVAGQTLTINNDSIPHKITGVIKNIPTQSHFTADFFLSILSQESANDKTFNHFSFSTYVLLKPGADYEKLQAKFPELMRRSLGSSMNIDKFEKSGNYIRINLTPLKDIHLQSNRQRELSANGNIQYVYIFSAIALFILVLACINFMNLSTARSANRAREVGVRKVLGSSRWYLIAQFISESLMVTFVATLVAVLAAWLLLPVFNQLSGKSMAINLQTFTWLSPAVLIIVVVVGVLSGSYPAFFLSAFQPADVLKGKISSGFKGGVLRSFLVVFQFSISIFLIIGTLVIYNQLKYIQNKDLGFNRDQLLIVKNVNALNDPKILKQEIKQLPGVADATLSAYYPTNVVRFPNSVSSDQKTGLLTEYWSVDEDYLHTMGMHLSMGRYFSGQFASDSSAMVINQAAANMLGYTNDVLNKPLYAGQDNNKRTYHIIGVVKDFNYSSLRDNIGPLVMVMNQDWRTSLCIKVSTKNLPAFLAQAQHIWKTLAPTQQFEYTFMDEDFDALYRTKQRMGQLFLIFTTLAIVIACLGLFGLAAYAAEQRNKEIGIRKVLGASVSAIVTMLSKDFIKLVLISFAIAAPLAWFAMYKWLQGFAYRQEMQWWMLPAAGLGAVLIAFVTISSQSFKAAIANPVDSLKNE
ncbi:putative ABC transport system permease protein [Mucilaginibacter pineti]|uniref:Putative ABC transport system permease protein n=1 Tax=Mucilaginibacter pineti TaxID=1391627 RepID=A0A1G7MAH4_9SPHI|nr:ABC transporter permease [Mucilaginibacter pineti]SDF58735.1 putative ABC transport system permease protein [Mucilaginibacter pineti]